MSRRQRGGGIRRKDVAAIVDADAGLLVGLARAAGRDQASAEEAAVAALDALWRRGEGFSNPVKRRCFLLHALAEAGGVEASPPAAAFLLTRCGLTDSQAGYVLNTGIRRIASLTEGEHGDEGPPIDTSLGRDLRRRLLIRASRLLLPIRKLAVAGVALAVLGALAVGVHLAVRPPAPADRPTGAGTRPAAATRP